MRSRGRSLVVAALILVGAASLCSYFTRPKPIRPGITVENAKRILVGSSTDDIEAIIGHPPQIEIRADQLDDSPPIGSVSVLLWSGTECDILVYLDRDRKVVTARSVP